MSLKISSTGFLSRTWLQVNSDGIDFLNPSGSGSREHFRFNEIECILLSRDGATLSFQVRNRVFSVPVKPDDSKHQTTIATFVSEVKRAGEGWNAPPT